MTRFVPLTCATLLLVSAASVQAAGPRGAARHKDPLAGAPAVRHRYEIRKKRFEFGPSFGITLNRSLRHAFLVGGRVEYHFTDWLSAGAEVQGGVNFDAGLAGELEDSFAAKRQEALWQQKRRRFSNITLLGDVRLSFTPFSGKMAIFSKAFVAYDFYAFAGFGFALLSNDTNENRLPRNVDGTNEGFRPGFAWGLGLHLFMNHWVSVGLEVKDMVFADNETGWDLTRGASDLEQRTQKNRLEEGKFLVDEDDRTVSNHVVFGLNVTFYLPLTPKVSR